MVRIFTYKVVVFEEDGIELTKAPAPVAAPVATPITAPTQVQTKQVVTEPQNISPSRITNISYTTRPSNLSQNLSDVPITQRQRTTLNEELVSIGSLD